MTHDTPEADAASRRWCENCGISVVPETGEDGPTCPSCGERL
ncbi:endonuclease Q family protein [Halapricum sp. CBA1109]|nr:endonuclease Q family protein [Halapricum sp. CBA1109]